MTLQSSGTICLNDVHIELGAASGTGICMNDSDARALAGYTTSGSAYCMNHFYGKSARSATITTVGRLDNGYSDAYRIGYGANARNNYFHFEGTSSTTAAFGSINKTTGLITSGTLYALFVVEYWQDYHLEIHTSRSSNGGWTSVTLYRQGATGAKYTFNRTSASKFTNANSPGNPTVSSGTYRWTFTDYTMPGSQTSSQYHAASDTTTKMSNVHAMFEHARANNLDIYADWT